MRILYTSNPLVGHWLPMLPLARAAQEAGHDVIIATGPDAVPEIERRGFTTWSIGSDLRTIQTGMRSRPRSAAETDEERTVADGLAMFADPAIARARALLDRTADWRPDVMVQEIYELGGTYVPAQYGVPVVCLPRGADQFANAEQVARTGAGITLLPDQVSPESIRDATRQVLDETSYTAVARKLRSEIELLPDPSTVVEELTRLA